MKLQVLNLAVKLYLTNPEQTDILCRYLFSLARYDENYDIRDRARFLKPFIFPSNGETMLSKQAKRIFLSAKPAPLLISQYCREQFQLGSLAHYLNARTTGYHDLPEFPKKAPDSSVRGVETVTNDNNESERNENTSWWERSNRETSKSSKKDTPFYSDSENGNGSSEESDSDGSSDEESGSASSENESESGSKSRSASDSEEESSDASSSEDTSSEASSGSDEESDSDEKESRPEPKESVKAKPAAPAKAERSNLDLLLDLDDIAPSAPIMTPSMGGFLTPMTNTPGIPSTNSRFELVGSVHVTMNKRELLNKINGQGLQVNYRFTRAPHLYSAKMVSIELTFHNDSNNDLENINLSDKSALPANVSICDFPPIGQLSAGQTVQGILGVDFNDSSQPVSFEIKSNAGSSKVSLKPTVGEVIRAVRVTETVFKEEQSNLRGMNEHSCKIDVQTNVAAIQHSIFEVANLAMIANNNSSEKDVLLFAGQTMSSQSLVLVTVERSDSSLSITINCEKMVIGSMLLNEIKNTIKT